MSFNWINWINMAAVVVASLVFGIFHFLIVKENI